MSHSTVSLNATLQSLLSVFLVNVPSASLQTALRLRADRGRSFEHVVGGALAECLIEAGYETEFINGVIDAVLDSAFRDSLERLVR